MYFVHSGIQDESLQVTISKLLYGSLTCTAGDFLHRGHSVNVPNQRTAHLFSVIPANDTKESMFKHWNFSGNLGVEPLAPEASVLATELPRFPWVQWIQSSR